MRFRTPAVAALALVPLFPAAVLAQEPSYPEPSNPGKVTPAPRGEGETLRVCKRGCRYSRIQAAVNAAAKGDTIRVANGTYREAVRVRGARKSYVKLIGNPGAPDKVVLKGGGGRQNGVFVNGADRVTVRGFKAQDYAANGFFFTNVVGYKARNLIAAKSGVYGIYAFNSKGGTMRDSEAYYHSDAGFYIGQTPAQDKPVRSVVSNVASWGNPVGFSATNMRYVTITRSRFYNNGIGVVPNALESEKFPPAEDNVIRDNEIFWNNFNFHAGAPFQPKQSGVVPLVPIGTGLLLLGGRRNTVEENRIYGNYAVGAAAMESFLVDDPPTAGTLVANEMRDNAFGLAGTDLNGRDLAYDGNGSANCFGGNSGVTVTIPADGSTFAACPFAGPNAFNPGARAAMIALAGEAAVRGWIKHPHAPKPGFEPLEVYTP